jgi:opacity protein-like surface antigen
MKKLLALVVAIALLAMPAAQAVSVKGSQGQQLTVSATTAKNGSMITVRGNRFDETVGIYLAFCVVPKKGELPTPCGGGVNKAGTGESSFWISSNPPPYAVGLTDEFLPGGRFTHRVKISKKIGKFDCTKVKCAITVRADHLRGNDRSYDMFVPVKIK